MRDRFAAKEADVLDQIDQYQSCSALLPLGEDRVLRRYWVFRSTGGVFVEDPCAELPVDWRGHRLETESSSDDKENVKIVNGNGAVGGKMTTDELMAIRGQHPWAFYSSVEEVSALITALNKRGFRESQLLTALHERHSIVSRVITACPVALLTSGSDVSKQRQSAALMLELSLRDRLLDLEERIYVGGLGSLTQVKYSISDTCLLVSLRLEAKQCVSVFVGCVG
jgi:bromodomain adjacent to zinc finger domain protein 1A